MNERKISLIESGMKLFAEKGYHNTSVQEIVTEAGISKGSFYLYFKSKEEFITKSFHYFHTELTKRIKKVIAENHPPQDSLAKQITVVTEYIFTYKNYIIMHLREDITIGQNTEELFKRIRLENFEWLRENIKNIYGDKINPYLIDSIIQMEGLMNAYFQWIVFDYLQVDQTKIGAFLVERLDDTVQGMLRQNKESIILKEDVPGVNKANQIDNFLITMKEKIATLDIQPKKREKLSEVVDIIQKELGKIEYEHITIQGLLAHFKNVPELQKECEQVASVLHIKILD